jgi:hypothetical protein
MVTFRLRNLNDAIAVEGVFLSARGRPENWLEEKSLSMN